MPHDRRAQCSEHADVISDALVEEIGMLHSHIEGLEIKFKKLVDEARAKAAKAANEVKKKIHDVTAEMPPLEKLKHMLKSKEIIFASNDTSIMITHGANVFHIEADSRDTLKVSYADIVKEHLSPKDAMDVIQGRRLAIIFAPPAPVCAAPPPVRLVPSPELLRYSAAILQQQQQRVR